VGVCGCVWECGSVSVGVCINNWFKLIDTLFLI
jgi:hypothetical protein